MFFLNSKRSMSPALFLAAALSLIAAATGGAAAGTNQTLYSFCAKTSCSDGTAPSADLAMDAAGNLYGTTAGGGSHSSGTIFELVRKGPSKWLRKNLHSFCHSGYPCPDGTGPAGKLVIDVSGNIYGTAVGGGSGNDAGVVFELSPNGAKWTLKVLYAFCSKSNCTDGKTPTSGLTYLGAASGVPYDGISPLYGTTEQGGANGQGAAFQLTQSGGQWSESTIYDFCAQSQCADGAQPWQGLVMNAAGQIFGVTYGRPDSSQYGVVFQLTPGGDTWTERVLYSFCQAANCTDGRGPNGLALDITGALFGTTYSGGTNNAGLAFRLLPRSGTSIYKVLYNFCSASECRDGAAPASDLIIGPDEDLYGTTYNGGNGGQDRDGKGGGTVFRLTPRGALTVVRSFCVAQDCTDGEYPNAGLAMDAVGHLFGTTQLGGQHSSYYQGGTIFETTH
jgi:uncharacterized repeat protein (TIGR03803 family)